MTRQWNPCLTCGKDSPFGCRTCRPPLRLTEHGRDVLESARLFVLLLLSLALVAGVDGLIR